MRTRAVLLTVVAGAAGVLGAAGGAGTGGGAPAAMRGDQTRNVTLRSDLLGCSGDGLVIGAAGSRSTSTASPSAAARRRAAASATTAMPASRSSASAGTPRSRVRGRSSSPTAPTHRSAIACSVTYGVRSTKGATVRGNDLGFFEVGPASTRAQPAPAAILPSTPTAPSCRQPGRAERLRHPARPLGRRHREEQARRRRAGRQRVQRHRPRQLGPRHARRQHDDREPQRQGQRWRRHLVDAASPGGAARQRGAHQHRRRDRRERAGAKLTGNRADRTTTWASSRARRGQRQHGHGQRQRCSASGSSAADPRIAGPHRLTATVAR